jgi:hypothetical protein
MVTDQQKQARRNNARLSRYEATIRHSFQRTSRNSSGCRPGPAISTAFFWEGVFREAVCARNRHFGSNPRRFSSISIRFRTGLRPDQFQVPSRSTLHNHMSANGLGNQGRFSGEGWCARRIGHFPNSQVGFYGISDRFCTGFRRNQFPGLEAGAHYITICW